jgi:hypothetical protein
MSENLKVYNQVRTVPKEALKEIQAGRMKGKSDINPMWRIKVLTEQFGMCGFGWKYEILSERLEHGGNEEISAFVKIHLYVKVDGEWSEPIPGTGGNSFVTKETKGLHTSDECFKMALTDAISVACKSLGIGADVYWNADKTKYSNNNNLKDNTITEAQIKRAFALSSTAGISNNDVKVWIKAKFGKESTKDLIKTEYEELCDSLEKKIKIKEAQEKSDRLSNQTFEEIEKGA